MENQYHEGAMEPQPKRSDFSYAPPVSVSKSQQAPEFRMVVIPIGLLVSVVMLVAYLLNPTARANTRAESSFNAGNSAYNALDYDQAIVKFGEAIRQEPDFGEAYNNRGLAYQAQGNFDQAIADFDQAVNYGGFASVYNNRGVAYRDIGEYDKAIADFGQAIERDLFHTTASYYDNRAGIYLIMDDYDAAIVDFDAAIRTIVRPRLGLSPDSEPEEADMVDQSVDEHLSLFEFQKDLPLIYARRGLAYLAQDNLEKSLSDLDRTIKLQPKLALAYLLRGVAYRTSGNYERAIDDFRTVLVFDNDPEMQSEAELQLYEMGVPPMDKVP